LFTLLKMGKDSQQTLIYKLPNLLLIYNIIYQMNEVKTQTQYPLHAAANGEKIQPVVAAEVNAEENTQKPVEVAPPAEEKPKVETQAPATPTEPTDEEILSIFNKRHETNFKTIEEILPKKAKSKDEIEAEEKRFKDDALEWGLGTGKISRELYEKSIVDKSKTSREIALSIFTAGLREEDKDITNEEAEEIFKDTYHEDKETDNPRLYKLGQKRMAAEAEQYLKANYSDVDGLEDSFREYTGGAERFKDYGKQVKTFFGTIPAENKLKFEYTHANGKKENIEIEYNVSDEDIKAIQKQFTSDDMFIALGANKGEVSEKTMNAAFNHHLKARVFDKVLADVAVKVADRTALETMAYLKGIKIDAPASLPGSATVNTAAPKEPPKYPLRDAAMAKQGK
jgi:hypothetical protein